MWWNIIPSAAVVYLTLAGPHVLSAITNYLLVGNFYRRSLDDLDTYNEHCRNYMRDTRLAGSPYLVIGLGGIPEKTSDEEKEEESLEEKCIKVMEEKELKDALCREPCTLKTSTNAIAEAEEKDKCQKIADKYGWQLIKSKDTEAEGNGDSKISEIDQDLACQEKVREHIEMREQARQRKEEIETQEEMKGLLEGKDKRKCNVKSKE